jgi:hypothetical protein
MTADDVAGLEKKGAGHRYPTNTGVGLSDYEILSPGVTQFDFGAMLDSLSGRPLYLGRTRRSASLEQWIALLVSELVCTAPGCCQPLIRCDAQHMHPWSRGERTDITNLTGQCFHHHPADGSSVQFNGTAVQEQSGGARARARNHATGTPKYPPREDTLFDLPA